MKLGKGIIIVINKWDIVDKQTGTLEKYKKGVYEKLSYISYAPIIFISAKTRSKNRKIISTYKQCKRRKF